MATPPPIQLDLDNTFGALLIGVFIAAALWGVTCSQTFMYFTTYSDDLPHLKILVATVWLLDTAHQALICHTAYTYLVTNFANVDFLARMVNTLVIEVYFNGFVALLVQGFFARRVWILSQKNSFLTALVSVFVAAEFVVVMVYACRGVGFTTLAELSELKALSLSVNAIAAAGDVIIAALLCYLLYTSRTGFDKSDTMISRLITFSINTGLVTSICALASLITITALPNAFIYITFYFTLGRLYSNSLLATLNARRGLREASNADNISMSTRGTRDHSNRPFGTSHISRKPTMSIKVDTHRRVEYDAEEPSDESYKKGDFLPSSDDVSAGTVV